MKLGFLGWAVEDVDKAARLGFDSVELGCGALGDPKTGDLPPAAIEHLKQRAAEQQVEIIALGYYGLAFDPPAEDEIDLVYERVFDAAEALGIRVVASMSGFNADLDWHQNLEIFAHRFNGIAKRAEQRGIKLAIENWMGIGRQLPFKPRNMGGSPDTWQSWFERVPSPALGLEFDPSHLYWQGIDAVRAIRDFGERIYHFHAKDTEMLPDNQYRYGINGSIYRFRLPGYGEMEWPKLISALIEAGYDGGVTIEHEDPVFSGDRFDEGLIRGLQVLYPLIHPGATPLLAGSR